MREEKEREIEERGERKKKGEEREICEEKEGTYRGERGRQVERNAREGETRGRVQR